MEDNLKEIMQPKLIKSQNNGCGTASGNLVVHMEVKNNKSQFNRMPFQPTQPE